MRPGKKIALRLLCAGLLALFLVVPVRAGEDACDPNSTDTTICLPKAPAASSQPSQEEAHAHGHEATAPATNPDEASGGLLDLYGVVMDVRNVGPAPGGDFFQPVEGGDMLQRVTVRLDSDSRAVIVDQMAKDLNALKALPDGPQRKALLRELTAKTDVFAELGGLSAKKLQALSLSDIDSLTVTVDNVLGGNPAYNIPLSPGARVLLNMEQQPETGKTVFYIANRDRTPAIMILSAVLILAVLVIGGVEVSKHMLLAGIMLTGVYKALFPAVLNGTNGLLWAFLMCVMFTVLGSFIYQVPGTRAFSREQSVVVLGTLGGLLVMAALMYGLHFLMPLGGISSEGLANLWYQSPNIDYWALFLSSVLIGYLGYLFYLCWQLAQLRKQEEGEAPLGFSERFDIVMLRGRRLLGPMLSSLFLLFIGLFAPILLQMQGTPTAQFMNLESTASMLAFALAGGLTLILTVPLTALIAAWRLSPPAPLQ